MIERWIRKQCPELNGDLHIHPISGGLFNSSFFVSSNNKELVLRVAPPRDSIFLFYERNMMRQEPELHRIVKEQTTVPVPEVLVYDESLEIVDRECILMERLPGDPLSEVPQVSYELVMQSIGEYLAQIHSITADQYGYLGPHQPMAPQDRWVDAFHVMWNKLIDDLVYVEQLESEDESMLRKILDKYLRCFDRPVPASLLHMDVWHENILVNQKGQVTGLIDWDRGLWGDPEIEFAVLDYCGISTRGFWRGYGKERDQSQEAQVRHVFYYLYELFKYVVIEEGRKNNSRAANAYKQRGLQLLRQSLHV